VDDILTIHNNQKINKDRIEKEINKIDKNLEFKMTPESNNIIHYLDLTLQRRSNSIELSIYRKPTNTDITIQYKSIHPFEHKISAFRYYIHRMTTLPITENSRVVEWNTIITTAINNGYPKQMMYNLRRKLTNTMTHKEIHKREKQKNKKITFTFYSPVIKE